MKQFSKDHLTALWSVTGIGRKSFKRCLLAQKKARISDEAFWSNHSQVWQKSLLSKKQIESIIKFKKEHNFTDYYQKLKTKKIRVILDREQHYPSLLKNISQPPPVLFYKAREKISANYWNNLFLAVVGTRRITGYGRLIIKNLLRDCLLSSQAKLVSGFMYGVDVEAMKIAQQLTQTLGILGYGFDYCYPRHQKNLMDKMLEEGAIFISEYPPFIQPSAGSFVQRNRIIAGLAQAVMVVEAAKNSGSLITAQCAVDEGRTVLAVPGPITNPYSLACHQLIKEGACLVASVEDFYVALNLVVQYQQIAKNSSERAKLSSKKESVSSGKTFLSDQEEKILSIFQNQGMALSFDQLALTSHYDYGQLAECLLKLEIKQIIKQEGQNYILKT
ncbi:MAG: DNA-protecting protein DprA [Candidatus Pacebacteria bacterium]|nr:DNA-protecting protein DprA [Candidatus Paceibacterota bacterium]